MTKIAELAAEAFEKRERVKMLEMLNMPQDYDARKAAFIQLAEAREAARLAGLRLSGYGIDRNSGYGRPKPN